MCESVHGVDKTSIFLDFDSTKQGLPLVDSWSRGLDKNQMYPDRNTLSNVPRSGYITARDQRMVESGVTKGGKNTARSCQFSFSGMNTTTQTRSLKLKSNDFKSYPRSSQKKNSSL